MDPGPLKPKPCCCSAAASGPGVPTGHWLADPLDTAVGTVPTLRTRLSWADHLGNARVRVGIGRMSHRLSPGLYAVGEPDAQAAVLVTANYKLTVDHLRRHLDGLDAWVLVLDTEGINVWCAAAKGTFGTGELIRRVKEVRLAELVSHRRLVVPQLGAPGVCAAEVKAQCGFRVEFGPVRAADLQAYLAAGMQATPAMRRVRFPLRDRLVLAPVELTQGLRLLLPVALTLALLGGLGTAGWETGALATRGLRAGLAMAFAFAGSVVLVPALLPWLPGRRFAVKGAALGMALAVMTWGMAASLWVIPALEGIGLASMMVAIASFVGLNYTGTSTYTSLSGVQREMLHALPAQALGFLLGLSGWLAAGFL